MSAETYKLILTAKGRLNAASFFEHGVDEDYTEEQLFLRQDLSKNKAVWVGDYRKDLWYYLSNMNPILASCYSHPLHPITRTGRYLVYLGSFFFVSNISVSVALASTCEPCQFDYLHGCDLDDRLDCTDAGLTIADRLDFNRTQFEVDFLPDFCCGSSRLGALWFLHNFGVEFGSFLYSLLANLIFSLTCFQLLMCPCVQQQSMRVRRIGQRVGCVAGLVVAFLTLRYTSTTFGNVWHLGLLGFMTRNFVETKLVSWLGASVFNVCLFYVLFWVQNPKPDGSGWKWLDAPEDHEADDTRPGWAKGVNPRFHVLASEHQQVAAASLGALEAASFEIPGQSSKLSGPRTLSQ